MEERLFEDTLRRQPSASSRKKPQKKPNRLAPDSWTSSPQNSEEIHVCGLSHLSVISCYGSPSKRMHCQWAWGFLWYEENVVKLYTDGCTTLNILKAIDRHSFNGWMLRNVSDISIKLFEKKRAHKSYWRTYGERQSPSYKLGVMAFFPLPHGSYPWTGWELRPALLFFQRAVNF